MVLVASELVTNALQHASGPIVMVLQQRDETVLVEVADVSPALPCHAATRPTTSPVAG
jgi:anti-sigma regulatory factor (Ser/Thr protein kinase)